MTVSSARLGPLPSLSLGASQLPRKTNRFSRMLMSSADLQDLLGRTMYELSRMTMTDYNQVMFRHDGSTRDDS